VLGSVKRVASAVGEGSVVIAKASEFINEQQRLSMTPNDYSEDTDLFVDRSG
jgi:hypothetical protein